MKKQTIVLLIAFVREVVAILTYQGNVFPAEHSQSLVNVGEKLIEALAEE